MRLSRDVLKELIIKNQIVTDYADLDGQLTANGFDCRLAAVIAINQGGKLAVKKEDNRPPELGTGYVLKQYESRIKNYDLSATAACSVGAGIKLKALRPYFVLTCEQVNIPENMMVDITTRSSLFRLTQSQLLCSFGEAGYKGFLTYVLVPFLDCEIELGSRFSQIAFSELKGTGNYKDQKEHSFQGGKIF